MNAERSNCSTRIRRNVGPRIFGYPAESFAQPDWRYQNCRELIGWTKGPGINGEAYYNPFAPIIYQDGRPDVKNIFLNKALLDVSSTTSL